MCCLDYRITWPSRIRVADTTAERAKYLPASQPQFSSTRASSRRRLGIHSTRVLTRASCAHSRPNTHSGFPSLADPRRPFLPEAILPYESELQSGPYSTTCQHKIYLPAMPIFGTTQGCRNRHGPSSRQVVSMPCVFRTPDLAISGLDPGRIAHIGAWSSALVLDPKPLRATFTVRTLLLRYSRAIFRSRRV